MADKYKEIAKKIRRDILALIFKGQTSHIASCFSLADIAVVLYENLKKEDTVVWSKGWASALYYVLGIRHGLFDRDEVFNTFPNYPYPALLEPPTKGVQIPTGSVGHGLSFAAGVAYAKKQKGEKGMVYCLMSDGELNEGSVWEAIMFASHHELDNLVAIIDQNKWQAMGRTTDVLDLRALSPKFSAFGWSVQLIDGHDYLAIETSLDFALGNIRRPKVIVADTVKGRGVSFMEDHLTFHYKHLDSDTYQKALAELNA